MVGLGRLELPTPRLSSVCSNQLSYRPNLDERVYGFVFMKKEKRGRRSSPYHPSAKHFRGVLRFDGRLTGAIYVLKSIGKLIRSVSGILQYPGFLRKEVIQPQVPLRLPCYDFTPVADPT